MATHILFLQGAGEGAHEADKLLASSLEKALGKEYEVHYPKILNDGDASYDQWKAHIIKELQPLADPVILVGHSMGASILAKYLSEAIPSKPIKGHSQPLLGRCWLAL
jgi:predicted alpha/beta hydrolase family esterase